VKRGLISSRALSVREMALDPKVKDELVKHILGTSVMFDL
jgi:hypothetical protein